jgi:hypothetical protein
MPGVTPAPGNIHYPDANTDYRNLGAELKLMAEDISAYIVAYAKTGAPGANGTNGAPGATGAKGAQGNSAPDYLPADQAIAGWFANGATSASKTAVVALLDSLRPQKDYRWANATAKANQATAALVAGDEGIQLDNQHVYRWFPNLGWRLWHAPTTSFAVAVPPGLTVGGGSLAGTYSVSAGLASVAYTFTYGAGSVIPTGPITMALPFPSPTGLYVANVNILDAGNTYMQGFVVTTATGIQAWVQTTSGPYPALATFSPTVPMTWTATDALMVTASYPTT